MANTQIKTSFPQWRIYMLLGSLYFLQGLPFGFFMEILPVLMREQNYKLAVIGLSNLVTLPWALKWLWASTVENTQTRFGKYRPWILAVNGLGLLILFGLILRNLPTWGMTLNAQNIHIGELILAATLLNLCAATQDIATDGLAVRLLKDDQARSFGNGLQVGAYRIGMMLGAGGLAMMLAKLGFSIALLGMSLGILLALLPIFYFRENHFFSNNHLPQNINIKNNIKNINHTKTTVFTRLKHTNITQIIPILMLYNIGNALASGIQKPMLKDMGYDLSQIALYSGLMGSFMALIGAFAAAILLAKFSRRYLLFAFGLLQTFSILLFLIFIFNKNFIILNSALGLEHLFGTMATVGLFALMMDRAEVEFAAVDYTIFASVVVITTGLAKLSSGLVAQMIGYGGLFGVASVLSLFGAIFTFRMLKQ